MPHTPPEDMAAFGQTHGRGAAWGDEENRAVVRVFDPDGGNLRNGSGIAIQPDSGALWCTENERDPIGPNLAPDCLTAVVDGGFHGWPWYHAGGREDPAHAGERPDLQPDAIVPDVLLQARSSTMQPVFYTAQAFPQECRGDILATMRGSWNREVRTGYKVIRALMEDGRPAGVHEDFMTGFVVDEASSVWGRPGRRPAGQRRRGWRHLPGRAGRPVGRVGASCGPTAPEQARQNMEEGEKGDRNTKPVALALDARRERVPRRACRRGTSGRSRSSAVNGIASFKGTGRIRTLSRRARTRSASWKVTCGGRNPAVRAAIGTAARLLSLTGSPAGAGSGR